jgi:hypothetical protein
MARKKRDKSTDYLPFLNEKTPTITGEAPPDWYDRMSSGLEELNTKTELVELLQRAAPEIQRLMMIELLSAAPLPSPTAASSQEMH